MAHWTSATAPRRGRPLGATNRVTRVIKTSVLEAFEQAGGTAWLLGMAQGTEKERIAFAGLLRSCLPHELRAELDAVGREVIEVHSYVRNDTGELQVVRDAEALPERT